MADKPKKLPTYFVDFNSDQEEINFISMVHDPAIEVNWVAFNNQQASEFAFKQVGDQQKVAGPLMIPNMPIYRNDVSNPPKPTDLGEYYLVFTPDVIQKMADKFNMDSRNQFVNLEHQPDSKVPGAYVSENWIIEDTKADKSNKYGFKLPAGTWFGIVKIDNQDFWNSFVKEGKIRGFSIEGMLGVTTKKMNKMNTQKFAATITEFKLQDGTSLFLGITCTEGDITLGIDAFTDNAGTTPSPDGEFVTADGINISVLAGKVQGIETATEETAEPAEPTEAPATPAMASSQKFVDAKTDDGKMLSAESFDVGQAITLDGQPAPDGDYTLEDGSKVSVAGGKITAFEPTVATDMAAYPWDQCIADALKKYGSQAIAEKVCGHIKAQNSSTEKLADATTPVAPDATTPAKPAEAPADAAIKDIQGQLAVLNDRITALEDALNSATTENAVLASKVEALSKAPGAESITKNKLSKDKEMIGSKRTSFDDQLAKINSIKSHIKK